MAWLNDMQFDFRSRMKTDVSYLQRIEDVVSFLQKAHGDVIPENVDCVRALMKLEESWTESVTKTDQAISRYYNI